MSDSQSEFITAGQVRERFGHVSRMWLHRRLANDGFPQPVRFGGRNRFFRLSEIQEWERVMIQRGLNEKVAGP